MWCELLERNKFILNLYSCIPQLINVRIVAVRIEEQKVSIHFNMPNFADKPPTKWKDLGYNTVYVELDFFDIKEITLKTNTGVLKGDINIEKNEDKNLKISISGDVYLELIADVGIIQSVSGYIDKPEVL